MQTIHDNKTRQDNCNINITLMIVAIDISHWIHDPFLPLRQNDSLNVDNVHDGLKVDKRKHMAGGDIASSLPNSTFRSR